MSLGIGKNVKGGTNKAVSAMERCGIRSAGTVSIMWAAVSVRLIAVTE